MSYSPSPSPPPPMPSPLLLPTPLPSPPRRLTLHTHPSPPIPPSLVGSPLLNKTLTRALSHDALHRAAGTPRFSHDPSRTENRRRPSPRVRRTLSQLPSCCRSPPPSPAIHSPPPPVPPIPAFVLTTNHSFIRPPRRSSPYRTSAFDLYLDHPREDPPNMCCESQAGGPLTCMQFFAVHNPTGQCHS